MSDRFEIKNIDEALKIINDEVLEKIVLEFGVDFSCEFKFQGIFLSKDEISKDIRERLVDGINDEFREIKNRISHLRKKGLYVNVIDFNFLRVPLKIKMMMTEFTVETYKVVVNIFVDTKKELEEFASVE